MRATSPTAPPMMAVMGITLLLVEGEGEESVLVLDVDFAPGALESLVPVAGFSPLIIAVGVTVEC